MTTNERVIVLNLLREGKISTGDAEQLLQALADSAAGPAGKGPWHECLFRSAK